MQKLNMLGKVCPIPVIETKKLIKNLTSPDTIEILVDNFTAVENLTNLAKDNNYKTSYVKNNDKEFAVSIEVNELKKEMNETEVKECNCDMSNKVVVISSDKMGEGEEQLGKNLMKAFIYTMTQEEVKPKTILFYNKGAYLTTEGSLSLEDLQNLEKAGVEILTCGTCLNFYNLQEKLKVGKVTNMAVIYEKQIGASLVIKP